MTKSKRPNRLYLQIFEYETGGNANSTEPGYQIQFPKATLTPFFGVTETQSKNVTIRCMGLVINRYLSHFENDTHRIRIPPLAEVPRPAVICFTRIEEDVYDCTIIPPEDYEKTIKEKCPNQTYPTSRKWGFE
jgi:hypothetical protein